MLSKVEVHDSDYYKVFQSLQGFKTTKINTIFKHVYKNRMGVIHKLKTRYISTNDYENDYILSLWNQCYYNLCAFDATVFEDTPLYDDIVDTVECWKNILTSKYAFYIIVNGLNENKLFAKMFEQLYSSYISMRLFLGPLYKISFMFTPFMLYSIDLNKKYKNARGSSIPKTQVKDAIKTAEEDATTNGVENNWVYYLVHDDAKRNEMIYTILEKLLLNQIKEEQKPKKESKKSVTPPVKKDDTDDEATE